MGAVSIHIMLIVAVGGDDRAMYIESIIFIFHFLHTPVGNTIASCLVPTVLHHQTQTQKRKNKKSL